MLKFKFWNFSRTTKEVFTDHQWSAEHRLRTVGLYYSFNYRNHTVRNLMLVNGNVVNKNILFQNIFFEWKINYDNFATKERNILKIKLSGTSNTFRVFNFALFLGSITHNYIIFISLCLSSPFLRKSQFFLISKPQQSVQNKPKLNEPFPLKTEIISSKLKRNK